MSRVITILGGVVLGLFVGAFCGAVMGLVADSLYRGGSFFSLGPLFATLVGVVLGALQGAILGGVVCLPQVQPIVGAVLGALSSLYAMAVFSSSGDTMGVVVLIGSYMLAMSAFGWAGAHLGNE